MNIRDSGQREILEAKPGDSGRVERVVALQRVLQNGHVHGVRDTRGEDSRAETGSGGFGTRWANGSLGFALCCCHHRLLQGFSMQKELVLVSVKE